MQRRLWQKKSGPVRLALVAAVAALSLVVAPAAVKPVQSATPCTHWDLTNDFSIANNPNADSCGTPGVWYYLQDYNTGATLPNKTSNFFGASSTSNTKLDTWYVNAGASPFIGRNDSGADFSGKADPTYTGSGTDNPVWPAGTIAVYPPLFGTTDVVAGWKSPIQGTININGLVIDGDGSCGNGVKYTLKLNGNTLTSGTVANGNRTQSPSLIQSAAVNVGDVVYLGAAIVSGGCNSTGMHLTIDQVQQTAPTATATAVPPTDTPTNTATQTSTPLPTSTSTPANTATNTPTNTLVPTTTPLPTQAPTNTPTTAPGQPTTTPGPTNTPTTAPGQPSNTPAPTGTTTATGTATTTGTAIPTTAPGQPTNTPAPTSTGTAIPTTAPGQPTNTAGPTGTTVPTTAPGQPTNTAGPATATSGPGTAVSATMTATVGVTSPVQVHNAPRTVMGGHKAACSLQTDRSKLSQGCIIISIISAAGATVVYTLTYPAAITPTLSATASVTNTDTFTDTADYRGHSLHVFNAAYLPPVGAKHGSPLTIVRVSVSATTQDGMALLPGRTRFTVVRY